MTSFAYLNIFVMPSDQNGLSLSLIWIEKPKRSYVVRNQHIKYFYQNHAFDTISSWKCRTICNFSEEIQNCIKTYLLSGCLNTKYRVYCNPENQTSNPSRINTSQYSWHRFIQSCHIKAHIQSARSDWLWGTISPKVSLTNWVRRKYPFALLQILIKNVPQTFLHIKTAIQSVRIRPPQMNLEENEFSTDLRWKLFSEINSVFHCARPLAATNLTTFRHNIVGPIQNHKPGV